MDSNKKTTTGGKAAISAALSPQQPARMLAFGGRIAAGLLAILLALALTTDLRAQSFSTGGPATLGNFKNPLTVVDTSATPKTCNYNVMAINLKLGKVFASPYQDSAGVGCNTTPVDITALTFSTGITSFDGSTGVLEVGDFTLQVPVAGTLATGPYYWVCGLYSNLGVYFVANDNNTPVVIRSATNGSHSSTGAVTLNSGNTAYGTTLCLDGSIGAAPSGTSSLLRGVGGAGGPGGYRGGDGGNGGLSASAGQAGFGPGGGPGGDTGASPLTNARFLTTGKTIGGTIIPSGNDLLLMLRGGSGGGGKGGAINGAAGSGGGGGGGAIAIFADTSITINSPNGYGGIYARGGGGGYTAGYASAGSGGVIRLVTKTIAGNGPLSVDSICCNSGDDGIIRLEAFTISYTGTLTGNLAAASAPGQVVMPTSPTAFLHFLSVTDSGNPSNTIAVPGATQATPGRTGNIVTVDVTMPNPSGPATTVNVLLEAGPNTSLNPFPAGKAVTLVVQALDAAQQLLSKSYQAVAFSCPSPGSGNCTATVTGVSLPLGFSSMSAFTVVNLNSSGQLARLFPTMMNGEEIESVKLETTGSDTKYTLIAKSGKEFPFTPGGLAADNSLSKR